MIAGREAGSLQGEISARSFFWAGSFIGRIKRTLRRVSALFRAWISLARSAQSTEVGMFFLFHMEITALG
jgi:hypothetical protein